MIHVFVENIVEDSIFLTYFLYPFGAALCSGIIIALFSFYFLNRRLSQLVSYRKLKETGFDSISFRWQDGKEVKKMCTNAETIKIINVSGTNYYKNYEKYFKKAMAEGVKIYTLVADPDSSFLTDIEEMEKATYQNGKPVRKPDTYIKPEIEELLTCYADTNLQIRFYRSEYRLPFIIAYYKDGSVYAWLQVTLPPAKSKTAIVLRGKKDANYISGPNLNFIDMMEMSFDAIWDHSEKSEDKVRKLCISLNNKSDD